MDNLTAASGPGWCRVWEGHVSDSLFWWGITQWSLLLGLTLRAVSTVALVFVITEVDTRHHQRSAQALKSIADDIDASGLG